MAKAPAMKKVTPGLVKVTVRMTFADGTDCWRSGVTDMDSVELLAFKYGLAIRESMLFQFSDKTLPPHVNSSDELLVTELNKTGSGMTWADRFGKNESKTD